MTDGFCKVRNWGRNKSRNKEEEAEGLKIKKIIRELRTKERKKEMEAF